MKKKWLVTGMSLMAVAGFPDSGCQCNPCSCIEAECYSPIYRDIYCDVGVSLYADFLYWYGKESEIPYAIELTKVDVGILQESIFDNSIPKEIGVQWDPGVRVGVGFTGCSGWEARFEWNYYKNTASDHVSVPPTRNFNGAAGEKVFSNVWDDSSFFTANFVSGKWQFKLNRVFFSFGRHYAINRCVSVRPFFGASGYWTDTDFRMKQILENTNFGSTTGTPTSFNNRLKLIQYKNKNWGGGILGGFETMFSLGCGFSILSSFDMDLLWGKKEQKAKQSTDVQTISATSGMATLFYNPSDLIVGREFGLQPIMDIMIALQWKWDFCDCRYRSLIQVGWEHHQLFDLNVRKPASNLINSLPFDPIDGDFLVVDYRGAYRQISGDVMVGGFLCRVQLDF